jgi:hypothetical protein
MLSMDVRLSRSLRDPLVACVAQFLPFSRDCRLEPWIGTSYYPPAFLSYNEPFKTLDHHRDYRIR